MDEVLESGVMGRSRGSREETGHGSREMGESSEVQAGMGEWENDENHNENQGGEAQKVRQEEER